MATNGMNSGAGKCGVRVLRPKLIFAILLMLFAAQANEIPTQPVESSVIAAVGYDAKSQVLRVDFHAGTSYRYFEVPDEVFRKLLAADSKGKFFSASIRNRFRSERISPPTAR